MAGETRPFGELFAEPPRNGLTRPRSVRGRGTKMVNMGELFAHPRLRDAAMDRVPLSESEAARFLLRPGDLLFARQSLLLEGAGKCSIFLGDDDPVTFESHVTRVRLNPREAQPLFFFYYLQSPHGRAAIRSIVEQGAGASGIRGSDLATLAVHWRPVPEQRAIAHILDTLDEMIESNRRMSETLEAIASALFQSWFVDFDPVRAKSGGRDPGLPPHLARLFPNSFTDSGLGEVPTGWGLGALGDLAKVVNGCSYKSSQLVASDTALVTLKSIDRGGGYRSEGLKSFNGAYKPDQIVEPGEVVVACTDMTQAAEVVGRPAMVRRSHEFARLVASLDLLILRPATVATSRAFLYFLCRTERFADFTYAHTSGTTVLHLTRRAVPEFPLAVPPDELMRAFGALAAPFLERCQVADGEIQTLVSLRDDLLRWLFSGRSRLRDECG